MRRWAGGMDLGRFVEERFTKPLDMTSTGL